MWNQTINGDVDDDALAHQPPRVVCAYCTIRGMTNEWVPPAAIWWKENLDRLVEDHGVYYRWYPVKGSQDLVISFTVNGGNWAVRGHASTVADLYCAAVQRARIELGLREEHPEEMVN